MASGASCTAVFHGLHALRAVSSIPDGTGATTGRTGQQSAVFCLKVLRIQRSLCAAAFLTLRKPKILSGTVLGSEDCQYPAFSAVNICRSASVRASYYIHSAADKVAVCIVCIFAFVDDRTAAYWAVSSILRIAGVAAYRAELKLAISAQTHDRPGWPSKVFVFIRPALPTSGTVGRGRPASGAANPAVPA